MSNVYKHSMWQSVYLFATGLVFSGSALGADTAVSSRIDCTDITIDFTDRPGMTRAERLEAMNRAFFDSVNRFELCNLSNAVRNNSSAAAQASSNAGLSGSGTDGQPAGNNDASAETTVGSYDSRASGELSGTEVSQVAEPFDSPASRDETGALEKTEPGNTVPSGLPSTAGNGALPEPLGQFLPVPVLPSTAGNGALPEDIPAANNDDAVAAQIRLAAEIEQDPVKQEKLWNEYRKYKGLPAKTSSNTSENIANQDTADETNETR